jgi:endoglucanase
MQRRLHISALLTAAGLTAAGLFCAPAANAAVHPAAADPVTMTNGFYVNPDNSAAVWAAANPSDGREPAIKSAIAAKPDALWFTGSSSEPIGEATGAYVGAAAYYDQLPVLVAYNITDRDICAGQSSGGASSDSAYDTWIAGFAGGIAARPALVILEPDALADESCMTSAEISDRDGLLNNAVNQFNAQAPDTWVYLDAGNPGWIPAATMAADLNSAGLAQAHGFSLNVSNFYTVAQNTAYGNAVNADLSADYGYTRPFVIDTSRNADGSNGGQWCNPSGMKLGATDQVGGGAEMLLWIKTPGESDGDCGTGGGTTAGQFDPQLAYNLVYGY